MNRELLEKNFTNRGFKVSFYDSKEDAAAYLCGSLEGKKLAFGGSGTLKEMGLYEKLSEKNEVIWHWVNNTKETKMEALTAEVYLLSANGVSEKGDLVNIDGAGNRLAASLFGPGKVIYVIGKNKIEKDLESAMYRARNVASPKNAMRFGLDTPCVKAGGTKCFDCNHPQRICNGFSIVARPMLKQEVEVLFVDEVLGY